jgi:hypothetical protein
MQLLDLASEGGCLPLNLSSSGEWCSRISLGRFRAPPVATWRLAIWRHWTTGELVSARCPIAVVMANLGAGGELQRRHCAATRWSVGCWWSICHSLECVDRVVVGCWRLRRVVIAWWMLGGERGSKILSGPWFWRDEFRKGSMLAHCDYRCDVWWAGSLPRSCI